MTSYKDLFRLYDLIESSDIRSVQRFLLNYQVNINEILPCKGISILHLAVGIEPIEKSKQCTEILLKHGADPNICSDEGMTPLHIAAIWGRVENIKLLIGCGGDPSRQDLDGHSAFDYAVREQQWNVYDYLHNVEDELDNSLGSPCAYSLDLDKILVTTDQVVAEYGPVTEEQIKNRTQCRKSELVREWCDKTTLIMNKVYPTILTETYVIDDSIPWHSDANITLDLTVPNTHHQTMLNETKTSFKTCLSKKLSDDALQISGVRKLDETIQDNDCYNCLENKSISDKPAKKFSVYENFSLPGSPNNIVHTNYNTKSCLRKCKEKSNHETKSNDIIVVDSSQSLITNDSSEEANSKLNDAMAVVQNKTNEWLSSNSSKSSERSIPEVTLNLNTRRSSASSGVSSSFSGGNVTLASVEEEFKYEDKDEDVVLIEKRLLLSSVVLPIEDELHESTSPENSILSVASSLPTSVEYNNHTLRAELVRRGFKPGPIDKTTRTLYLKKLYSLRRNPIVVNNLQGKTYSVELEKSLRSDTWMKDLTSYAELERKARSDFSNPNKKWREGAAKTSFTYLLLDPRMTDNLPARASKHTQHENWTTFVNSIFYVGKGKRSRPYSHLYQALTLWKRDFTTSKDKKVQHILDIWTAKVGVVCLHIFQNVIPAEAYTYEAAMIDVLGVANLKNLKTGNYYGVTSSWPLKERRMLGLYLLYKAMLIFLSEGERQLRPGDID